MLSGYSRLLSLPKVADADADATVITVLRLWILEPCVHCAIAAVVAHLDKVGM